MYLERCVQECACSYDFMHAYIYTHILISVVPIVSGIYTDTIYIDDEKTSCATLIIPAVVVFCTQYCV